MNSLIALVFVTLFSSILNGQTTDSIWIKQTKVVEAIAFEKLIEPNVIFLDQSVGLGEGYYPLHNKYQVTTRPIIAKRTKFNTLPVYAANW